MRDLIKHDALLWLVVFQQLWLVYFYPYCFTQRFAPSAVRCRTALLLLYFLIVGIHAPGIPIPLSLLMLSGWSLYELPLWPCACSKWGSRSINFTSFQSGLCPVLCACSEMAEVSVRASWMPRSCSLILSCIGLPVSPMFTLPHSQGIL